MASEIVYLPLVAGVDLKDSSSEAAASWRATVDTVSAQEGFQKAYYGMCVEKPNLLQLVIDWNSVDDHIKFTKSDIYGAFKQRILSIVDPEQGIKVIHAHWNSHPPTAPISAPVTEFVIFHLPGSISAADKQEYKENALKFNEVLEKHADGLKGVVGGWVVEELEHEGQKTLGFACLLGWNSVQAHMLYRETQSFKETIPLMRTGTNGAEMHHITFNQLQ